MGVPVGGILKAADEIVGVLEKAPGSGRRYQYLVLDTMRTSTIQEEISQALREGYEVAAMVGSPSKEHELPVQPVMVNLEVVLEKELKE